MQAFKIHMAIYPFEVIFSIDQTDAALKTVLDKTGYCDDIPLSELNVGDCGGLTYSLKNASSIVRLKSSNVTGKFEATLSHEVLHVVTYTMSHVGIKLSDKSVEAYCYLQGYLIKEFYNKYKPLCTK